MPDTILTQHQKDIDTLEKTTRELEITLALASSKVGHNELLLKQVEVKLDLISHTLGTMNKEIVAKQDLEASVNSILNKHAAKVFWSVLGVSVGAALAWMGSLFK